MKFKQEWQDYRTNVLPKPASSTQLNETKKAFYAGALAVVSLTAKMFSEGQEVTDSDVDSYDQLVKEIVSACESFTNQHEMN